MVHLSDMKKPISCTVIGDGMVGKTCLSEVFSGQTMPQEYVSTVFNNYAGKSTVGGDKYVVSIFDSAGEHEYTELRSFSYKDSEVLLLCFSVSDRDSFESVKDFWAPEVKDFLGKRVPIIVVATQTDTRSDLGGDVSTEEGQRMAKEIGAERYLECSCSDQQSVHSVFENVVLTALKQRKRMGNIFRRVLGR
ncbi:rho-related GTP-binding protein RhoJ-like [Crassostrea angulata]|uniref:Rho-related GTP-binding protein RhoJ n=2 Tax=Magallana gigas TaxID=29159 RepID=K1QVM2_MAGGI|nr:rho-related GTP-binding protein RhoJ [Crassostrea gigas]XP_052698416.1 rho-related GTP-binding protein RhoJ-like [Crassostrea angulata]|eukprot:XP_011427678.1 PREDICTED: rho-related GTP-binding protein RhoJ [Crassostrea gigas]